MSDIAGKGATGLYDRPYSSRYPNSGGLPLAGPDSDLRGPRKYGKFQENKKGGAPPPLDPRSPRPAHTP
ncbi:hypothetical protein GCM10017673_58950 [Streptosporangium violaceochromogenes]|nr:hypothetical protein GCM10017673_58950 [Streptosporangium violaceochromogenes]